MSESLYKYVNYLSLQLQLLNFIMHHNYLVFLFMMQAISPLCQYSVGASLSSCVNLHCKPAVQRVPWSHSPAMI